MRRLREERPRERRERKKEKEKREKLREEKEKKGGTVGGKRENSCTFPGPCPIPAQGSALSLYPYKFPICHLSQNQGVCAVCQQEPTSRHTSLASCTPLTTRAPWATCREGDKDVARKTLTSRKPALHMCHSRCLHHVEPTACPSIQQRLLNGSLHRPHAQLC